MVLPIALSALAKAGPLSSLSKQALKVATGKTAPNLKRRAQRLAAKGLHTEAVSQVLSLKPPARDASRNEWLSYAARVAKLDQSPAVRAATANPIYQAEQRRRARNDLVSRLSDPSSLSKMSEADMNKASAIVRKRMQGRIKSIESDLGETATTRRAREILDQMSAAKSRQAKMSALSKASRAVDGTWTTFSKAGARRQHQQGIQLLGSQYGDLTAEQQAAVWDEIHKHQAIHSLHSEEAVAQHRELLDRNGAQVAVTFTRKDGHLRATFGATLSHADAEQVRENSRRRALARLQSKSRPDPLGGFVAPTRRPKF